MTVLFSGGKLVSRSNLVLLLVVQNLFLFHLLQVGKVSAQTADDELLFCDVIGDRCPSSYNGNCDNESNIEECQQGDCFDCDRCKQYHYDCFTCVNNGCQWCPGDATCYESNLYPFPTDRTTCPQPSDYQQSCDVDGTFFSDPLYKAQEWVYTMINVIPVWEEGILGTGIRVRVNDDGVEASHNEFDNRFDIEASCELYLPNDPLLDEHGTAVASILAGGANNDQCAVGIAPNVTISSCYALGMDDTIFDEKLNMFDISSNSFGFNACDPIPIVKIEGGTIRHFRNRRLRNLDEVEEEFIDNKDDDITTTTMTSICPFTYFDSFKDGILQNPCNVCNFIQSSMTSAIYLNHTNEIDPKQCEESIIKYCKLFYENDSMACIEFIDLLIVDGICRYNRLSTEQTTRITNGIVNGRDGKGIIYVFASGNEYTVGDDVNFEGFLNTRFTIAVGAVGKDKIHSSYSTSGAALFISAPGGDKETQPNHVGATLGGRCKDVSVGTSYAAPVVSGVIALMLNVNPNLTWRDVQAILAKTSRMVLEDDNDTTRITNAAGYKHSNLYGFGIVDAQDAVNESKIWNLLQNESMLIGESINELNLILLDDPSPPITSSISITKSLDDEDNNNNNNTMVDFIVESVVVYLDIIHISRGDLYIVLTSPSGTESILHPGNRPENNQPTAEEQWKFLTVRNWGESGIGEWKITIQDISEGNVDQRINNNEIDDSNNTTDNNCFDGRWTANALGYQLTCDLLEFNDICMDGIFNETWFGNDRNSLNAILDATNDKGLTLLDSCCACGGGQSSNDIINQLVKWKVIIYGQSIIDDSTTTESNTTNTNTNPTFSPTSTTTTTATVIDSKLTFEPSTSIPTTSDKATLRPTSEPTLSPTSSTTNPTSLTTTTTTTLNPTTTTTTMSDHSDNPSFLRPSDSPTVSTESPTHTVKPPTGGFFQDLFSSGRRQFSTLKLSMIVVLISTTLSFIYFCI